MTTAGAPTPDSPATRTADTPVPGPAAPAPSEGAAPDTYLVIAGHLLVIGKQPDGDSLRFRPEHPELLAQLAHGDRVEPSADGSVQLRLDGIDAPELHFAGHSQPLGDVSRDAFLRLVGFEDIALAPNHMTVTSATPPTIPAVILARMAEVHGRPVAFLFTGEAADTLRGDDDGTNGHRITLDADLLATSANMRMVASGDAYPLLYTSTSPVLRKEIAAVAGQARAAHLGVYAADATARFSVVDHKSVGPGGDLIYPKLFRRVTEWLREADGAAFPAWLRAHVDRNDRVHVAGSRRSQALHTLLHQSGHTITMTADPLTLVFVER
ncbi:MAG: hypothetical protein HOV68_27180 [Streptomycetaceae bacterium]|nr:hypothetical protein [Streptomycetaceae bacterium]